MHVNAVHGFTPTRRDPPPPAAELPLFCGTMLALGILGGGLLSLILVNFFVLDDYPVYVYSLFDALNPLLAALIPTLPIASTIALVYWVHHWNRRAAPLSRHLLASAGAGLAVGALAGAWLCLGLIGRSLAGPLGRLPTYTPEGYPLLARIAAYQGSLALALAIVVSAIVVGSLIQLARRRLGRG